MTDAGFAGFAPEAVEFLTGLRANNNRDWFTANKPVYERAIKRPAALFVAAMADRLAALTGTAHDAKIYRMHRDLRFGKDKTPYNAHLHIGFTPDVAMASPPCWFFGLDPDKLVLGAGVFGFDKAMLAAYLARIDSADGDALAGMLDGFQRNGIRITAPELKRVPSAFAKDHPRGELLRRKGLSVWTDFPDTTVVTRPDLVAVCMDQFSRLKPVFDWLMALDG